MAAPLSFPSYILIACYCALVASPFVLRRFLQRGNTLYGSFAVGARNFGWFRIAAGLSATFVGGAAVINVAGLGYTYGWYGLTDALACGAALLLSAFVLVPRLREKRNISLGGFLRVSGPMVNAATGLLSAVVYTLITAAQIVALIKLAQPFFPVPAPLLALIATMGVATYVFWGGYAAVAVTDVIQFIVVTLCYFALVLISLCMTGPSDLAPAATSIASQIMPLDKLLLLALPLLFIPVSQDLHIRINSARSAADARLGTLLAGLLYLGFGVISVTVGRTLAQHGVVLASPDDAVPTFLAAQFGSWALVPTIAVIFVVLSTLDSVLFASASSLSYDFWDQLRQRERDKDSAHPRIALVIVLGVALLIALQAPRVLQLILSALVIYVAVLLPLLVGRFLGRRSRLLGLVAFAALGTLIVLETLSVALPYRAFLYTAIHLVAVLCLPKDHEKTT